MGRAALRAQESPYKQVTNARRLTICSAMTFATLDDAYADYELLDADDRYRLLIDLGRALEPMPEALKTDATLVRGCSAAVWVYPVPQADGRLHFLADSNAAITKGIVALVLLAVQDRSPGEILATDIEGALGPFDLRNQLSSNRTQGIPNMIALVRETAGRLAA
jgi:cysteine desulfuration protein SufE